MTPPQTGQHWQHSRKAQTLLASLRRDQVHREVFMPIWGDRIWVWRSDRDEQLEAVRQAAIVDAFGDIAEADARGETMAWIDAYSAVPSVATVLAERFGDPSEGVRPPYRSVLDGEDYYGVPRHPLQSTAGMAAA